MKQIELVRRRLPRRPLRRLRVGFEARAAVLMSIVSHGGAPCFLLTKRTQTVATHKGQVSFPGGYAEAGDSTLCDTALRETLEELGIPASNVEVLGPFHEYLAITRALVRPYVGILHGDWPLKPNPDEVDEVLQVPLRFFVDNEPQIKGRRLLERDRPIYSWDYENTAIWGLTAAMIKDFVDELLVDS